MFRATVRDHRDGSGELIVRNDEHGRVIARKRLVAPEGRSVLVAANHALPELGFDLDYGWFEGRWEGEHTGPVVRLGERTSVWD